MKICKTYKRRLLFLAVVWILLGLAFNLVGCEPYGGGYGYQYLGTIDSIHRSYVDGECTTTITVCEDSFDVAVEVKFSKPYMVHVWVNTTRNSIRFKRSIVICEYEILRHTGNAISTQK